MAERAPQLEGSSLTKTFGGVHAVDDVSLTVERGQIVGLIGPNGAGKTTLFNLLSGFARPTAGRVRFAGRDVTRLAPSRRVRAGLVRTFQHSRIFADLSVYDNLRIACHATQRGGLLGDLVALPPSRRRERAIAERVEELVATYELEPIAGRRADELPYGSTKRVGLVMALAAAPSLVLLDEPAAGLNLEEIDVLGADLRRLRESGVTVLFVEHHMGLVMDVSDRVIVLDAGAVIAEGAPADVAEDPRVAEAYLGVAA